MDKWNEICFIIKQHNKENTREAFFQNEVVNIFEKLGWSRYRNEIETEKNIPIGATKDLRLDILISFEGEKLLPVELKRATNPGSERISRQLISYMLQERLKFGLFIGENIQLFYDVPSDNKHPIKLIEIEFTENNLEGNKLIGILKRDTFDEQNLLEYCKEKLLEIEESKTKNVIIDFLSSSEGNEYITDVVLKHLKEKYGVKIIEELESEIHIEIMLKKLVVQNQFEEFDSNLSKSNQSYNKPKIKNRTETNKRTENGLLIGEFVQMCFRNAFKQGLISESEINDLQKYEYSKKTFNSNLEIFKNKNRDISDNSGRKRYYAKELFCANYYLTAQWVEPQWDLLLNWLKKIGYDYKKH